ncbi:MAG: DUF1559 domain-containing protein [Thermoguttaceae bacterium]
MQFRLSTLFLLFVIVWASMAMFGIYSVPVCIGIVLAAVYLHGGGWLPGIKGVVCIATVAGMVLALSLPTVESRPPSPSRMACLNNLNHIALALHNYGQANGCFPPAYVADKNGKPMHSWRVLILPYLEGCTSLYKQYNFAEPWDGPSNRRLLAARPSVFRCPAGEGIAPQGPTETSYAAVVGRNAAWKGPKPTAARDLAGAFSTTVMVVEASDAGILWTEPRDLSLDAMEAADNKMPAVGVSSRHSIGRRDYFCTYRYPSGGASWTDMALADGCVICLPRILAPSVLAKVLRVGGYDDAAIAQLPEAPDVPALPNVQLNWDNIVALIVWLLSVGWLFYRAFRSRKWSGELAAAMTVGETEAPMNANESRSDQSSRGGKPRSGGSQ